MSREVLVSTLVFSKSSTTNMPFFFCHSESARVRDRVPARLLEDSRVSHPVGTGDTHGLFQTFQSMGHEGIRLQW